GSSVRAAADAPAPDSAAAAAPGAATARVPAAEHHDGPPDEPGAPLVGPADRQRRPRPGRRAVRPGARPVAPVVAAAPNDWPDVAAGRRPAPHGGAAD